MVKIVKRINERIPQPVKLGVVAASVFLVASPIFASTIPEVGVDMPTMITEYGVKLGIIVASAIGLTFAFIVLRHGLSWAKSKK